MPIRIVLLWPNARRVCTGLSGGVHHAFGDYQQHGGAVGWRGAARGRWSRREIRSVSRRRVYELICYVNLFTRNFYHYLRYSYVAKCRYKVDVDYALHCVSLSDDICNDEGSTLVVEPRKHVPAFDPSAIESQHEGYAFLRQKRRGGVLFLKDLKNLWCAKTGKWIWGTERSKHYHLCCTVINLSSFQSISSHFSYGIDVPKGSNGDIMGEEDGDGFGGARRPQDAYGFPLEEADDERKAKKDSDSSSSDDEAEKKRRVPMIEINMQGYGYWSDPDARRRAYLARVIFFGSRRHERVSIWHAIHLLSLSVGMLSSTEILFDNFAWIFAFSS